MKLLIPLLAPLAVMALPLLVAELAHAWEPGPAAVARAASGKAWAEVEADGPGASGVIRGVVDIDAAPETVWRR